jgi:hypothetical protein
MPDRVPSAEDLRVIRRLALDAHRAARRYSDAERRLKGFSRRDRSPELRAAIEERDLAAAEWCTTRDRCASFLEESRATNPRGWPEGDLSKLEEIRSMLRWTPSFFFSGGPDEILTRLEEAIESLPGGAIDPEGSPGSPDELNETDRTILRRLAQLRAFDRGSRKTKKSVVEDPADFIANVDSKHIQKSFTKLKGPRMGLIETRVGADGGVWLTARGREMTASEFQSIPAPEI